jgi:plasmid maintenance system killer protein
MIRRFRHRGLERLGQWSVAVNANWRIVFSFEGEDACDVHLVDYH